MPKHADSSFSIIPKAKPKTPFWQSFLLGSAVFLIVITATLYFFLNHQASVLGARAEELASKINRYNSDEFKNFKEKQITRAMKIKDVALLFENHQYASKLFRFLKRRSHPQAQITSFNFNATNYQLSLEITTRNFLTLGEQLLIFLTSQSVKDLALNEVALNKEGRVEFSLGLSLDKALVKK